MEIFNAFCGLDFFVPFHPVASVSPEDDLLFSLLSQTLGKTRRCFLLVEVCLCYVVFLSRTHTVILALTLPGAFLPFRLPWQIASLFSFFFFLLTKT